MGRWAITWSGLRGRFVPFEVAGQQLCTPPTVFYDTVEAAWDAWERKLLSEADRLDNQAERFRAEVQRARAIREAVRGG